MGKNNTASISAEPANTGDYVIVVQGWDDVLDTDNTGFTHTIHLDNLRSFIQHLDNAYEDLMVRRTTDAICGDCDTCHNVRMVHLPAKYGGGTTYSHCPVCHPKMEVARAKGLLR